MSLDNEAVSRVHSPFDQSTVSLGSLLLGGCFFPPTAMQGLGFAYYPTSPRVCTEGVKVDLELPRWETLNVFLVRNNSPEPTVISRTNPDFKIVEATTYPTPEEFLQRSAPADVYYSVTYFLDRSVRNPPPVEVLLTCLSSTPRLSWRATYPYGPFIRFALIEDPTEESGLKVLVREY
ncbi:hypothetical protein [Thermus tengchongensis]|uniref:hypothetical protein n=1 Tax=Thermus tengchongensis TaxID=1214928 RepID=UPI00143299EF|nr:hypothetical protein [Thermus tengchongensis]